MQAIRTILCPVDFSDASREALRWAAALATRHQSHLVVLTAVEPLLANAAQSRFKQDLRAQTEPALKDFAATALPSSPPPATLDVQVGNPADVVLDAVGRHAASVLVMGTHGIGGFRKVILGSTTERVLRRATVPVLAVPCEESPSGDRPAPEDVPVIATVLAATDFSEASDNALRWAAAVARRNTARLVVVHVVPPLRTPAEWMGYAESLDQERLDTAREQLAARVATLDAENGVEQVVTTGSPLEAIAETARTQRASLLVMGLVGAERILGPRPGSTAYGVLSSAKIPVLVVPADAKA